VIGADCTWEVARLECTGIEDKIVVQVVSVDVHMEVNVLIWITPLADDDVTIVVSPETRFDVFEVWLDVSATLEEENLLDVVVRLEGADTALFPTDGNTALPRTDEELELWTAGEDCRVDGQSVTVTKSVIVCQSVSVTRAVVVTRSVIVTVAIRVNPAPRTSARTVVMVVA